MHISVLLEETITSLNIKENGTYVDATLGFGGHSSEILKRIKKGYLFAFDQDRFAIDASYTRLKSIGDNFLIIKNNFKNMRQCLKENGITEVDGILFDLGVSSYQLDTASRGFSFHQDAPLDMRMDRESDFSAKTLVNTYSESDLKRVIANYGEEKYASSIARNIVKKREEKEIETTLELVDIIRHSMPAASSRDKHPARRTFQAIRIEVNHELDILEESLQDALAMLKIGGRLSVITFHSLEDKIVKNLFKEKTKIDDVVKGLPEIPEEYLPDYLLVTKKGITASEQELRENPRARSATLRVIERIK